MLKSFIIPQYNEQKLKNSSCPGVFHLDYIRKEVNLTIEEYKKLITSRDPSDKPFDVTCNYEIKKRYNSVWSSINKRASIKTREPIYASDIEGTLFPETMKRWNLNRFTPNDSVLHEMNEDEWMKGIHYSFLYIGSKGSMFSFHVEDQNLNSISYLHEGAPKVWYGVPLEDSPQFEELVKKGTNDYTDCDKPMRHKSIFTNRKLLESAKFDITEVCS